MAECKIVLVLLCPEKGTCAQYIFFFFFYIGQETLSDICADNEYKIAADFLVLYAYCGLTSYMSLSCSRKGAGVSVPEELQAVL